MRNADKAASADPTQQLGIGWYQPKRLRVSTLKPAAGNVLPPGMAISRLSLVGVWLDRLGFTPDCRVLVDGVPGRITLILDETPVVVPYRYRRHTPKKKRSRAGDA